MVTLISGENEISQLKYEGIFAFNKFSKDAIKQVALVVQEDTAVSW